MGPEDKDQEPIVKDGDVECTTEGDDVVIKITVKEFGLDENQTPVV